MGNGVAVVEIPEYDNQMRGRGIKVSNNDPWYQRYYKENKHKPSKMELRELAREIWTGHNEYGLFGWENHTRKRTNGMRITRQLWKQRKKLSADWMH